VALAINVADQWNRAIVLATWPMSAGSRFFRLRFWARSASILGSAVWDSDNLGAQAEIQIPDLGSTVRSDFRRNVDKSLPASHH
jgi:hypothetical protein